MNDNEYSLPISKYSQWSQTLCILLQCGRYKRSRTFSFLVAATASFKFLITLPACHQCPSREGSSNLSFLAQSPSRESKQSEGVRGKLRCGYQPGPQMGLLPICLLSCGLSLFGIVGRKRPHELCRFSKCRKRLGAPRERGRGIFRLSPLRM
jgi:hypothetical protein